MASVNNPTCLLAPNMIPIIDDWTIKAKNNLNAPNNVKLSWDMKFKFHIRRGRQILFSPTNHSMTGGQRHLWFLTQWQKRTKTKHRKGENPRGHMKCHIFHQSVFLLHEICRTSCSSKHQHMDGATSKYKGTETEEPSKCTSIICLVFQFSTLYSRESRA